MNMKDINRTDLVRLYDSDKIFIVVYVLSLNGDITLFIEDLAGTPCGSCELRQVRQWYKNMGDVA